MRSGLDRDRLAERMTEMGLDRTSAAVYLELLRLSPSKASHVATALDINRSKAYRVLDDLQSRGFVSETLETPTRYRASDPDTVFDRLLGQERRRLDRVDRVREELLDTLEDLHDPPVVEPPGNTWRVVHGRMEIFERTVEMIERTTEELVGLSTTRWLPPGYSQTERLRNLLVEKARDGVDVRVIHRVDPEELAAHREILEVPNLEIRHVEPTGFCRFFIADRREILTWMVSDPSPRLAAEGDVAIWADTADYVEGQRMLYDWLWAEAEPIVLEDL